ncbi:MAG: hypothetical protein U0324_39175 [Polyangiales bacterium]
MRERKACCEDPAQRCGTRWKELCAWVGKVTGKGWRLVELQGDEQGRAPFFAQPVGYDGRTFFIARDGLCDTEKLMHEACHFLMSPKERRHLANYGLGPGPFRPVDDLTSDNEEVAVTLLQYKLAARFSLPEEKLAKPDYNVANKRHLDWDDCHARADALFEQIAPSLPALPPGAVDAQAPKRGRKRR